nr:probable inactive protein kinase isoform X1 [Tanacetum cinerariifolium]
MKVDLKKEMKNELKEEMREELKEYMREELKEEIRTEIQDMLVDYGINYQESSYPPNKNTESVVFVCVTS